MISDFRFMRQKGKPAFARVWVDGEADGNGAAVVADALPDRVNPDEGEVNARTAPGWVAAALEGITQVLEHARQAGWVSAPQVRLVKLVGTVADTTEDAVRCAAGCATWKALQLPDPGPEAEFDGVRWHILFPVGAGQGPK